MRDTWLARQIAWDLVRSVVPRQALAPLFGLLASAGLASLVIVAGNIAEPLLARQVVDKVLVGRETELLSTIATLWVLLFGIQHLALFVRLSAKVKVAETLAGAFRRCLFSRILAAPYEHIQRHRPEEFLLHLTKDIDDLRFVAVELPLLCILFLFSIVGAVGFGLYLSWQLMLYISFAVLTFVLAGILVTRKSEEVERATYGALQSMTIHAGQLLSKVKLVYFYSASRSMVAGRFRAQTNLLRKCREDFTVWEWAGKSIGNALEFIAVAGILLIGGSLSAQGTLSAGSVLAFILYINVLCGTYRTVAALMPELARSRVAAERLRRLLDQLENESSADNGGALLEAPISEIELTDVFYGPPDGKFCLQTGKVCFKQGRLCIITGENGAGKTTLLDLLCGLLRPARGEITVNGTSLQALHKRKYLDKTGVLPQEDLVFALSIRENLALASCNASNAQMAEALLSVGLIEHESDVDAFLARNAGDLSTGQKRLLAISRTLLRKPELLIMDEPTANLDAASSEAVIAILKRTARGRVTIVTTQDPLLLLLESDRYHIAKGFIRMAAQAHRGAANVE